jgi:hypothetical protein
MTDSEEPHHAYVSHSGGPIRGRGCGCGRGHGWGRSQHGFAQEQGSPSRQHGGSAYDSPQGGRRSQRFGQNSSLLGERVNSNDEYLVPRELFEQL